MKTFQAFIIESSLSRVHAHMKQHDSGAITAFRDSQDCGKGDKITKRENKQRNKSLKAKLHTLGYGLTAVKGQWIENMGSPEEKEVGESVFLVVDLKDKGRLEKDLRKLGKEFEQDSILYIKKGGKGGVLWGTSKCKNAFPDYDKPIKLSKTVFGKTGEFFTRVNGRPFILKEDVGDIEDITRVSGFFGRWSASIIASKEWNEIDV